MGKTITGYQSKYNGRLYSKDIRWYGDNGNYLPAQHIIIPSTVVYPTISQVISHLQTSAQKVFENNKKRVKSTLDQMLSQLPEKILLDIRKGELDLLYSIKYHLSAKGVLDRPTSYLNVEYGIIPTQTLYDEKKKSRVPELYEHILLRAAQINPAAAETFSFNLLLENSSLPNREELDVLLKHGTTFSKSLLVDRNYELSKITPVIDFIYENFSKTAQRKHLSDMSDEVLAIYAALPIVALLSSIPVEKKSTRKIQKQAILMPNTGKILEA